jgi:ribosomal protein S18 acetylase RimI-like enzyme
MIRKMMEEDLDSVREIEAIAFRPWWQKVSGNHAQLPVRTRNNVRALLLKDPEGCFIAEEGGQIVGFIFSRTWGHVGWFGTFAVLHQYQGRGIGKELIAASLKYLRQDPQRAIGLETMPESPYNLGLYLRQGFEARFPTPLMTKEIRAHSGVSVNLQRWSQAEINQREQWLYDLRTSTELFTPSYDYSKEVLSTDEHGLGESLILTNQTKAIGMSIIWLASSRVNMGDELASIQVLAIHPEYTNQYTFSTLINQSEALGRLFGKQKLTVPVNASHTWAIKQLFLLGFRVERMAIHMVMEGTNHGPITDGWVNCSRWAG